MTSNRPAPSRAQQQDAHAWAALAGSNYTAALRQMRSPLTQGLLGDRISARRLIATLEDHELVGAHGGEPLLGENGFRTNSPWQFDKETDLVQLALITEMLRMFTPDAATGVGSYTLKHTAEKFLRPHFSYVSNGRLIWAAAAMGLELATSDGTGPNLRIGISEREHDYVRRMIDPGSTRPQADHFRPAAFEYLRSALAHVADTGEPPADRWIPSAPPAEEPAPFHDWLVEQAGRDDIVGDLAADYEAGVRDSVHRVAHTPEELLAILRDVPHSPQVDDAIAAAFAEWTRTHPSSAPFRTRLVSRDVVAHEGWGAGSGTVERYEFLCPCGKGVIIEEHDHIPGFRDQDVHINCDRCRALWRLDLELGVRDWGLRPIAVDASA